MLLTERIARPPIETAALRDLDPAYARFGSWEGAKRWRAPEPLGQGLIRGVVTQEPPPHESTDAVALLV